MSPPAAAAAGAAALAPWSRGLLLPAILAPPAVLAAAASGVRALLPILGALAVYPVLAACVRRGRTGAAVAATLLWAASFATTVTLLAWRDQAATGALVINGPQYRDAMFEYVRTGRGTEADPARFLPQHAVHLAAFAGLAAASGGLLGIVLGAVLLGYMANYVGALAAAGSAPYLALALGWPPWAIARVVAFVILGVLLSRPLLGLLFRRGSESFHAPDRRARRRWLLAAGALLVADVALKAAFAPLWARLLRPCLL